MAQRAVKVFGGPSGSSASIASSSSSHSISSIGNSTVTEAQPTNSFLRRARSRKSEGDNRYASASSRDLAPLCPPTPAFRYVEDSFQANQTTTFETSFVPRQSFEGDSLALADVPVWPPPVGVILLSPRESPLKVQTTSCGMKRRLGIEDELEDKDTILEADRDDLSMYFDTIRVLPRNMPLSPVSATPGREPCTADRRIAKVPKRYSELASKPPAFNLEPPCLPSLASGLAIHKLTNTSTLSKTKKQSREAVSSLPPMFIFGSPVQQPVTNDSFAKAMSKVSLTVSPENTLKRHQGGTDLRSDAQAVKDVWSAMQERIEDTKGVRHDLAVLECGLNIPYARHESDKGLSGVKRPLGDVRFEDVHQKGFAKYVFSWT